MAKVRREPDRLVPPDGGTSAGRHTGEVVSVSGSLAVRIGFPPQARRSNPAGTRPKSRRKSRSDPLTWGSGGSHAADRREAANERRSGAERRGSRRVGIRCEIETCANLAAARLDHPQRGPLNLCTYHANRALEIGAEPVRGGLRE